jgi:hypothetical protein
MCLAAGMVAIATAAPVPMHLMKDGPVTYYPVAVGTTLVYDRDGTEETRVISKVEAVEGGRMVTTELVKADGGRSQFHKVLLTAKGVFITERSSSKYPSPFELIRLPFKPGDKWEEVAGSTSYATRRAIREEKMKVPAGEFNCIRVESGGEDGKTIHWYAVGIGVVKVDYGDHIMELKSITHPKPGAAKP